MSTESYVNHTGELNMIWSKNDIRKARKIFIAPILKKIGYRLIPLGFDNFKVSDYGNLIIKHNYFYWHDRKMKGNAIDFFMLIEKKNFSDSMKILMNMKVK